jgi:hypothetical protein
VDAALVKELKKAEKVAAKAVVDLERASKRTKK